MNNDYVRLRNENDALIEVVKKMIWYMKVGILVVAVAFVGMLFMYLNM